ncbi:HTH domain-containing protein [Orbaceae bacterium ac157xtp]
MVTCENLDELKNITDTKKHNLSEEVSGKMSEENKSLNKTAQQILAILKHDPETTIFQLAIHLNVSTRTIERNIKLLQERQLLKRKGSTKTGKWLVIVD